MKKILFTLLLICSASIATAQIFNFGIKGGINYGETGDLSSINQIINSANSGSGTGYHIGTFAEVKLPLWLYLRPELVYTHTESNYNSDTEGYDVTLEINRIDAPILVGFRILKIGRLFLGPSFHYNINIDLENAKTISFDDFTVGAQFGLGLNFGRLGIDARWEMGLSDTQALFIDNLVDLPVTADTNQQQFIFSVYYKFLKKK